MLNKSRTTTIHSPGYGNCIHNPEEIDSWKENAAHCKLLNFIDHSWLISSEVEAPSIAAK